MTAPNGKYDHVFMTCAVLSAAAGVVFGFAESWTSAWGWFSAVVPYYLLARQR